MRRPAALSIATLLLSSPPLAAQDPPKPEPPNAVVHYRVAMERSVESWDEHFDASQELRDKGTLSDALRAHVRKNATALAAFATATAIERCRFEMKRGEDGLSEIDTIAIPILQLAGLAFSDGAVRLADGEHRVATTRCCQLFVTAAHLDRQPSASATLAACETDKLGTTLSNRILATDPPATVRTELRQALTRRIEKRVRPDVLLATERHEVTSMAEHIVRRALAATSDETAKRQIAKTWRAELERRLEAIQAPVRRALETGDDDFLDERDEVLEAMRAELKAMEKRLRVAIEELDPTGAPEAFATGIPLMLALLMSTNVRSLIETIRETDTALRETLERVGNER